MKWSDMTEEGRDRLVAEKVMGVSIGKCAGTAYYTGRIGMDEWYCETCKIFYDDIEEGGKHDAPIPSYSTDMNDAWKIMGLEKFSHASITRSVMRKGQWLCSLNRGLPHEAYASIAQEAVCIAALSACGVDIEP